MTATQLQAVLRDVSQIQNGAEQVGLKVEPTAVGTIPDVLNHIRYAFIMPSGKVYRTVYNKTDALRVIDEYLMESVCEGCPKPCHCTDPYA